MILDTGDYDEEKFPIPPMATVPSSTECKHTPVPSGYVEHMEWMEEAYKRGFRQVTCPRCGLWAIWLPKAEAKAINDRHRALAREIAKAVKREYPSADSKYRAELTAARKQRGVKCS
jgi:hypothetical protein